MPIYDDVERVKLRFLQTCETLVNQGRLDDDEFQGILELLDSMNDYDDEEFRAELSKISKGISDLIG
ncbi:MAG: hypothetical protein QM401_02715 [Bacillota bacterium]|nr:hypothetical protein [Bacillota bacterium]